MFSSKSFNKIIQYDPVVYIALDPDAEAKSNDIINKLIYHDIQVYKIDVSGFEDVGTMTKNQFLQRKEEAKLFRKIYEHPLPGKQNTIDLPRILSRIA